MKRVELMTMSLTEIFIISVKLVKEKLEIITTLIEKYKEYKVEELEEVQRKLQLIIDELGRRLDNKKFESYPVKRYLIKLSGLVACTIENMDSPTFLMVPNKVVIPVLESMKEDLDKFSKEEFPEIPEVDLYHEASNMEKESLQMEFCNEKGYPRLLTEIRCPNCKKNTYERVTLKEASTTHLTSCSNCNWSFC